MGKIRYFSVRSATHLYKDETVSRKRHTLVLQYGVPCEQDAAKGITLTFAYIAGKQYMRTYDLVCCARVEEINDAHNPFVQR